MDPERIGALLDGRLAPADRAAALARLAASEDERALFADTAAVLRALEEDEEAPAADAEAPLRQGAIAEHARRRPLRRVPPWAAGLLAAGIVLAVALPLAMRPRGLPTPEQSLAALASAGRGAPAGWFAQGTRGGSPASDPGALASAVGIVHARLLLADAAGDRAERADAVEEALGLLEQHRRLSRSYAELSAPGVTRERITRAGRQAARALGAERFRLGAWTETARLAVDQRDTAFFRSPETSTTLRRAPELPALPEPASAAVRALRALLASGAAPDWAAIADARAELAEAIT